MRNPEKNGPDQENSRKYLPFGKKIVKIGAVVTEIALLIVKKEEIKTSKIDSSSGKFAELAKNCVRSAVQLSRTKVFKQTNIQIYSSQYFEPSHVAK